MKVIISGATGFLGKAITEECLKHNDEVVVLVKDVQKAYELWGNNLTIVECALSDYRNFAESNIKMEIGQADVFYHLAWNGTSGRLRGDYSIQLANVEAACDALKLAAELKCKRFINAGSIMEYEASKYLHETGCEPGLGYIYSISKLSADYMLKTISYNEGIDYINAVISNIYGEGEVSERFINVMLRKMLHGESLNLTTCEQLYDFIYITDAAEVFYMLADKGVSGQEYYIGNSVLRPLKEFVLVMKNELKSSSVINFGKVPFNGSFSTYSDIDIAKVERELGYIPKISFAEGIKRLAEYERSL